MNATTKNFLAATFIGRHADPTQQTEILDMLGLVDESGMCTEDDDRLINIGLAGPVGGRSESRLTDRTFDDRPKLSTAPESLRVLPPLELVPKVVKVRQEPRDPRMPSRPREAPCGTYSARKRHIRRKEPLCDLCKTAPSTHVNDTVKKAAARARKAVCGTDYGYKRHQLEGTAKCQPCKAAHAAATLASARRQGVKQRPVAKCGTESGYSAHLAAKTETCAPCKAAKAEASRKRYHAKRAA